MSLKKLIFLFLFIAIGGSAGYYFFIHKKNQPINPATTQKSLDKYFTLKRGDLVIGLNLAGNVNAQKKHKLALEAAFNTKLLWVIDENTKVKQGQELAKFEAEELENKIADLKVELENIEKEIMISKEEMKILLSSNKASIRTANDNVTDAEEAFRKYHKFEKNKERDKLDLAIQKAQQAYQDAQDKYKDKKSDMLNKSYNKDGDEEKDQTELDNLDSNVDKAQTELNNANLDRKVFKRYTHPNKITDLENKLEQAKLNLEKTKIETASKLVQKEKSINNLTIRQKRKQKDLKRYESYVPMMILKSPVDGVVIYGDPDRRWGRIDIKVGMDVRRKQVLLTIPDMSKLVVDFDLPEQFRSKVAVGDKAIITPESIEGVKMTGVVKSIAHVPVHQIHWDRNSPKIYKSVIDLDKQDNRIVAGTSVRIEVVTKILKKVLFVPIEAIFDESGEYFVYIKSDKPQRRLVKIGLSNDNYVQITDGLEEGETVCLFRPFISSQGN
jgi:HlyD family secretion protein